MTQTLNCTLEIKALGSREFEGHGSVFRNVDLGGDVVVPGAFKRTLAKQQKAGTLPQMFWMHKADAVPGVWTEMHEDERGLYVKGELVDTQLGNEMRTLLQRKAVRGLSIGYQTLDFDFDGDGNRLLKEVELWEVSLVSLAMNPLAQVEAAKCRLTTNGEYVPEVPELEDMLRGRRPWIPMSQLAAKRLISAFREVSQLDDAGIRDVDRTRDVDVETPEEFANIAEAWCQKVQGSVCEAIAHKRFPPHR